jgi:Leucine-rich repeat (LRR) protein
MSQYLPNLRTLDLSNSTKLEKIIDFGEFPNLEKLNLKGCKKLVELDPSIGLLRKLVYLNLEDCYNLVNIPNNIFGLSSLENLNMNGCSKVFNNPIHLNQKRHDITESASHSRSTSSVVKWTMLPHHSSLPTPKTNTYVLPSLHRLFSLRNVDISFCHLSQVPDAIECLHWLERLNLGGNDFVTLPSLRKLTKLVYLNLEHCMLLESLPQLPFATTIGREQDENKYWWRDHYAMKLKKYEWVTGLVIFNCPKLGERECCSSMTFSWMMQFIKANQQSYFDKIQIVSPGREIPSWINNQSIGGSIQIDESPIMHDNNNNIIGFVCCAVFSILIKCLSRCTFMIMNGNNIRIYNPAILDESIVTAKSSHLWIIYFPRECYHEFGNIHFKITEYSGMKVESCGYRWVGKQDLQEFNLAMMNHEKSLARKCKILAIEDETQQQLQPEQVITTSQRRKSTSDNKSTAKTISVVNRKQRY